MSDTIQQDDASAPPTPEPAEAQTAEPTMSKTPDYNAFSVKDGKDGQSYFTKVGVGFNHRDNNGLTIDAEAWPTNGRLVLRTPKERLERLRGNDAPQLSNTKEQEPER